MDWYYTIGGQTYGPVSESSLDEIVQTGKIPSDTLVWNNGMANWEPYDDVKPTSVAVVEDPARGQKGTNQQDQDYSECAGFLLRAGAKILDAFLLAVIVVGLAFASRFASQTMNQNGVAWETISVFGTVLMFIAAGLPFLYNFLMLAYDGATVGKKIFGIKVVEEDGQPLGCGVAFKRCLVEAGCLVAAYGLGLIIIFEILYESGGEAKSPTTMQVCLPAILFSVIPYLPALFTSNKQATHDFVFVRTLVIRAR
jgi:uncharacterized RDD family membrane protein YckC